MCRLIFNLLYRRIAFCGLAAIREALNCFHALPITNRRYSRLQICATLNRYGLRARPPGSLQALTLFSSAVALNLRGDSSKALGILLICAVLTGCRPEPQADLVIVNGNEPESLDPA